MSALAGRMILTAAELAAAEAASGESGDTLMARAGAGVADWVARLAAGAPVLVACGPGRNGGDGRIAARILRERGVTARVVDSDGLASAAPAAVFVDALFGTGLSRGLAPDLAAALARLAGQARRAIAVDLPSGLAADDGRALSPVPRFDLTLALGAPKPAHLLAADRCGAVRVVEIGVAGTGRASVLAPPALPPPGAGSHKYSRGMVAVVTGAMAGAALLAGEAALRAGAGYVALYGSDAGDGLHALVRRPLAEDSLADPRLGAVLVGPGLGRDEAARQAVALALASGRPLVIDGDALHLVTPAVIAAHSAPVVVTPHAGEFDALFGPSGQDRLTRARAAAGRSGAIVVAKASVTIIAAPDGRAMLSEPGNPWLSTAGTGDVLAGAVAALLAGGGDAFAAAQAGVWLHGEAAWRLGGSFVADDLARALTGVRAA